ncbi:MAG TPA: GNAT family N-acetyltransferase [Mycobacteriales bacterium]|nr:GNAT family N-acetyltransferase [Mycobacteriales bacterium]
MVEIRRVTGDELLDTVRPLRAYAFMPSPLADDLDEQRRAIRYHGDTWSLVGFEHGRAVCAASALAMTQNVRGRVVPMAAIAGVATHPEARRRGWAHQVLRRLLAERAEAGDVVSCLYPFRESFYERLGFAGMAQVRAVTVRPDRLGPLLRRDLAGTVRLSPIRDGFEAYRDLLARVQPGAHGMALRDASSAPRIRDRNEVWVALAEDGGGSVVAAMTYRITGEGGQLRAGDLVSLTATGRYLLLHWVARHVDQVGTARLLVAPTERPETWQSDLDPIVTTRDDGVHTPMGRVLSIPALSGTAAGDGEFTARVTDPDCPGNTGEYRFTGAGGVLSVEPVPAGTAGWELPVQGLSALVYTGFDPVDLPFRGWGEPPVSVHQAVRAVFPPALPYLHEEF